MWHSQGNIHNIAVKASFFNSKSSFESRDLPSRVMPFLADTGLKTVCSDTDKRNFRTGGIIAQPDAVFTHKGGLISLEYKSIGNRDHSEDGWTKEIRIKDMLQCIIGGYAVAQETNQLTACVLRYNNVCYFLAPSRQVMNIILSLIPMAMQYNETKLIASAKLASFCEDKVREIGFNPFGNESSYGTKAHTALLRR